MEEKDILELELSEQSRKRIDKLISSINNFEKNIKETKKSLNLDLDFSNYSIIPLKLIKNKNEKNEDFLNKYKIKLEDLEENRSNLIKDLQDKIKKDKEKLSKLKEIENQLEQERDKVLVYKLLTNTNFMCCTDKVKGYVNGEDIKYFTFSSKKHTQKEITNTLYSFLKTKTKV